MQKPTRERVLSDLVYDSATGSFFWKRTKGRMVAGREAGYVEPGIGGRRQIRLSGVLCYAHQLVVLVESGEWPADEVDHIDGNPSNNKPSNLRQCSRAENQKNMRRHRDSKSMFKGVAFQRGKWIAQIFADGRYHYLGRFTEPEKAAHAYNYAAIQLHGRFAKLNEVA